MWDDTISKQLKRGNINMLVAGSFVALVSCAFLILTARTNANEILGPVPMTAAEVIKVQDPSKLFRYYIATTGSRVSATIWQEGYQTIDRKDNTVKSTSINSEIQLMQLEDKVVLIKRIRSSKDKSIAGALIKVPKDLDEVTAQLSQDPKLKAQLLPLLIDSTRFNWGGYFVLIIFLPSLIGGVVLVRKAIARMSDKFQNPSIQSLKRFGDARTILPEIEEELRQTDSVFRCSMLWLTKNWLITSKLTGIEIRSIKELVWVYPQTTSHSVNFVPTGKTHGLIICDSSGKYTQISLPSGDFATILETLNEHAPWAFYGFAPEYRQRWQSKNRASMIAEAEERRVAMESQ